MTFGGLKCPKGSPTFLALASKETGKGMSTGYYRGNSKWSIESGKQLLKGTNNPTIKSYLLSSPQDEHCTFLKITTDRDGSKQVPAGKSRKAKAN